MTTQTPRTDAAQLTFAGVNGMVRYAVPADFARQLERDLAAAQEELAAIRKTLGSEMVLVHEARTDREMLRNALVKESGFRQETERQLAAAQEELERVRDKCNEHYMALAAAQEALDAKDARIKELEVALRGMIDLAEYWINREDRREMSKAQYDLWLAVGHHSKDMNRARAALKDTP